jgi:pumilio homology domain family member 6
MKSFKHFILNTTTLWFQTIIPEILNNIDTIATDEYGRRVILSLVAWRDSSYFHPRDIELLKKGESMKEW